MLHQVRATDSKCFELGAVHSAFDPLVHRLTRHGRVYQLARLFHAVVIAYLSVTGPVFATGTASTEARKSIAEVHDCQLYHSAVKRAIALFADSSHELVRFAA